MLCHISLESRVPPSHPLRAIKRLADRALADIDAKLSAMYSSRGRHSVPPERLLKATLLMALYSVRSERQLCEQLEYNLLFRWFLGMDILESTFHPTTFTKNRARLMDHDIARAFFEAVVAGARRGNLLSEEHFSVDGTLIEAWASMKSFRPKDEATGDSNGWADFKGQKRSNKTHQSQTDAEARLTRKGRGKEAKLAFMGHALMENRNGLLLDFCVTQASGTAERDAALSMASELASPVGTCVTLGADKGYDARAFIDSCTEQGIEAHIARKKNSTQAASIEDCTRYKASQVVRRRVEEIFGWLKTVGGLRRTRYRGRARTELYGLLAGAALNLMRIARLSMA